MDFKCEIFHLDYNFCNLFPSLVIFIRTWKLYLLSIFIICILWKLQLVSVLKLFLFSIFRDLIQLPSPHVQFIAACSIFCIIHFQNLKFCNFCTFCNGSYLVHILYYITPSISLISHLLQLVHVAMLSALVLHPPSNRIPVWMWYGRLHHLSLFTALFNIWRYNRFA